LELDRKHFRIDLYDGPDQPVTDPIPVAIVIAEYFHVVTDLEHFCLARRRGKVQLSQIGLLGDRS
jgi:hypothetical protein